MPVVAFKYLVAKFSQPFGGPRTPVRKIRGVVPLQDDALLKAIDLHLLLCGGEVAGMMLKCR